MAIKGSIYWWLPNFYLQPRTSPWIPNSYTQLPIQLLSKLNSWLLIPQPPPQNHPHQQMMTPSLQAKTLNSSLNPLSPHPTSNSIPILPLSSKHTDSEHYCHLRGPRNNHLLPRLSQQPPKQPPLSHLCPTTVYSLSSQWPFQNPRQIWLLLGSKSSSAFLSYSEK